MNKYLVGAKYGLIKNVSIIPFEERTVEILEEALKNNCQFDVQLKDIPKEARTEIVYVKALQRGKCLLKDIPEEFRTEAVCIASILPRRSIRRGRAFPIHQNTGVNEFLVDIPEELRTEAIYLAALENNRIDNISNIPEELRTEAVYVKAMASPYCSCKFADIPEFSRTQKIYEVALEKGYCSFEDIPEINRTEKIYEVALKGSYLSFEDIPKDNRTESIYIAALEFDYACMEYDFDYLYKENTGDNPCFKSFGDIPEEARTEKVYIAAFKNGYSFDVVPEEKITKLIYLEAYIDGLIDLKNIPENFRTTDVYLATINKGEYDLSDIPEKFRSPEVYWTLIEKDELAPWRATIDIIMSAYKVKYPDITLEEVIEICAIRYPGVLIKEGRYNKVFEYIEEKMIDVPDKKQKFNNIKKYLTDDRYSKLLCNIIDEFWLWANENDIIGEQYLYNHNNDISPYFSKLIDKANEFDKVFGDLPSYDVLAGWEKDVKEYSEDEYKKLLDAGIIKKSDNYREAPHKYWILKMYQVFGYDNSMKLLGEIPEITPEFEEELKGMGEVYREVFEKKYILSGEISLTVEVINKLNNVGGRNAVKLFKELNKYIESGESKGLIEALENSGIDKAVIEKIEREIGQKINIGKMEKTSESLRASVNETINHHQGVMNTLLQKLLKNAINENKEITYDELVKLLEIELESKDENGEYINTAVIRNEKDNLIKVIESFMSEAQNIEILNDNIIKVLKRNKEKIGKNWIRKVIGIPQEMNEEGYKNSCAKLGVDKLEHDEEIRLRGNTLAQKQRAMELLKLVDHPELITFEKLEVMFDGLKGPYSEKFGEYFMKHKEEMMSFEYIYDFARMHNRFEEILSIPELLSAYKEGSLKVSTVLKKTLDNKLLHGRGEVELAIKADNAQLEEEYWPEARELYKIVKEREASSIPPAKAIEKKYRGRMLRVDDPLGIFVGNITQCCQRFGGEGEKTMKHSVTNENGGVFVVEELDEKGEVVQIVAQSWVWRNDDVMCFDNIEMIRNVSFSREDQEMILDVYQKAGENAIKIDESTLRKMLKNKEITEEQYRNYVLKEVRIGLGLNKLPVLNEKSTNGELEKSYDVVTPKAGEEYGWIDSESSVIVARHDKLTRQNKRSNLSGKVPVAYRKPREILKLKGKQIHSDIIETLKEIEIETFREAQQTMQDSYTLEDIAAVQGCEAKDLQVAISRDKDWYAMYYDQGESVYIADVAVVNGSNSQKSERKTDIITSSLELAKTMYEVLLEAAKNGKTVMCDATKDTSGLNIKNMVKQGLVKVEEGEEYNWNDEIEMSKVTIIPNEEKLEKEIKEIEKMLKKAEERRRVHKADDNIGGEDR